MSDWLRGGRSDEARRLDRVMRAPGPSRRATWLLAATAIGCVAAVAAALVTQYGFKMDPCPWCVLQRVIFLTISIACVIGLLWRSRAGRVLSGTLALLLAASGIAAALWQHYVASASPSCNMTLADKVIGFMRLDTMLPDVFSPRASCADAAVDLFGVPYDFWSLGLFALAALAMLGVLSARRSR